MIAFFVTKDEIDRLSAYTLLTLASRLPTTNSNKHGVSHYLSIYHLTPALLREFDDIATDLLINSVK